MTTRNEYIKHIWFDFQSSISFISLIDMIVCVRVCVRVRGHVGTHAGTLAYTQMRCFV